MTLSPPLWNIEWRNPAGVWIVAATVMAWDEEEAIRRYQGMEKKLYSYDPRSFRVVLQPAFK